MVSSADKTEDIQNFEQITFYKSNVFRPINFVLLVHIITKRVSVKKKLKPSPRVYLLYTLNKAKFRAFLINILTIFLNIFCCCYKLRLTTHLHVHQFNKLFALLD